MKMKFAICRGCRDAIRTVTFENEMTKEDTICPYCGKYMMILDRINDDNNYIWLDIFSLAGIVPLPARVWSETNNDFVQVAGLNSDNPTLFVYDSYNAAIKALSKINKDSNGNILFYIGADRDTSKEYISDDGSVMIQPTDLLREEYDRFVGRTKSIGNNPRSPFKESDGIIEYIMLKLYKHLF